jgi:hypothetical protein
MPGMNILFTVKEIRFCRLVHPVGKVPMVCQVCKDHPVHLERLVDVEISVSQDCRDLRVIQVYPTCFPIQLLIISNIYFRTSRISRIAGILSVIFLDTIDHFRANPVNQVLMELGN